MMFSLLMKPDTVDQALNRRLATKDFVRLSAAFHPQSTCERYFSLCNSAYFFRIWRQNHQQTWRLQNDVWYASKENMTLVKKSLKKDFIMPIKTNGKIA